MVVNTTHAVTPAIFRWNELQILFVCGPTRFFFAQKLVRIGPISTPFRVGKERSSPQRLPTPQFLAPCGGPTQSRHESESGRQNLNSGHDGPNRASTTGSAARRSVSSIQVPPSNPTLSYVITTRRRRPLHPALRRQHGAHRAGVARRRHCCCWLRAAAHRCAVAPPGVTPRGAAPAQRRADVE